MTILQAMQAYDIKETRMYRVITAAGVPRPYVVNGVLSDAAQNALREYYSSRPAKPAPDADQEQLRAELDRVTAEADQLRKDLEQARAELDQLRKSCTEQAEQARKDLDAMREQLREQRTQLTLATERLTDARNEAERTHTELQSVMADAKQLNANLLQLSKANAVLSLNLSRPLTIWERIHGRRRLPPVGDPISDADKN